jgi:hypothetical protein
MNNEGLVTLASCKRRKSLLILLLCFILAFQYFIWSSYVDNNYTWQNGVWQEDCYGDRPKDVPCVIKMVCNVTLTPILSEQTSQATTLVTYHEVFRDLLKCSKLEYPIHLKTYIGHNSVVTSTNVDNDDNEVSDEDVVHRYYNAIEFLSWFAVVIESIVALSFISQIAICLLDVSNNPHVGRYSPVLMTEVT